MLHQKATGNFPTVAIGRRAHFQAISSLELTVGKVKALTELVPNLV